MSSAVIISVPMLLTIGNCQTLMRTFLSPPHPNASADSILTCDDVAICEQNNSYCCDQCNRSCQNTCFDSSGCCDEMFNILVQNQELPCVSSAFQNGLLTTPFKYRMVTACPNGTFCGVEFKENLEADLEDLRVVNSAADGTIFINRKCADCHGVRNVIP